MSLADLLVFAQGLINKHAANASAHHVRYTDAEAITAMGAKGDSNALNHDKYTNDDFYTALAAIGGLRLPGWKYKQKFTISNALIGENLSYFPIALFINAAAGTSDVDLTPVFDELGANSLKLAVTLADGLRELDVEVAYWDEVNEKAVLFVSSEDLNISSSADTTLCLYYDVLHADNSAHVGVVGSTPGKAVWNTAYKMVHHMADNPDNSHIKDSTQYENNGTKKGAGEPDEEAGVVGLAQDFDGTDDFIGCGNDGSLNITDKITIEMYMKADTYDVDDKELISKGYAYRVVATLAGGGTVMIHSYDSGDHPAISGFDLSLWNNQWIHIAGVLQGYAGSWTSQFFVNGDKKDEDTNTNYNGPKVCADNLELGRLGTAYFDGTIDEVRISNVARSASWIATTNLTLTDALVTWGSVEEY